MRIRQSAAAAVLILTGLGLTGCAPSGAVEGITGLMVGGGRALAVVHNCPGVTADEVHLHSAGSWHFDAARSATVDLGSLDQFKRLLGSHTQTIQSSTSTGTGGSLRFTAAEIDSLADGQILAVDPATSKKTIVNAAAFDELVTAFCSS